MALDARVLTACLVVALLVVPSVSAAVAHDAPPRQTAAERTDRSVPGIDTRVWTVGRSTTDTRTKIVGRPTTDNRVWTIDSSTTDNRVRTVDSSTTDNRVWTIDSSTTDNRVRTVDSSAAADGPDTNGAEPRVLAIYPNPIAENDRGEYVRLALPPGNWSVSDGETTVVVRGPGWVTVTDAPGTIDDATRVVRAPLTLANSGGRVVVGPANTTDDDRRVTVVYRDAPEGSVWHPGPATWRPAGDEPRPVTPLGPANGTAFVLPDAPQVPTQTIRAADDRLFLAGYTFGSRRVTETLLAAADRGVEVRVLLEGGPVGGISQRQARLLGRLVENGVSVRVVAGPAPRVQYHHAKYAIADGVALVMTENWKPSGTGGHNRGWGVRLADDRTAAELAGVFRTDWTARDAVPWTEFRRGRTFESGGVANDSYPNTTHPRQFRANATFLLTAPGNARRGLTSILDTADRRIDVVQPTIDPGPLLQATKRAATRGVTVRILLSGAWYTAEENRRLADALNAWADRTGAPLSARLAESDGSFEKLHAKGLIVDSTVVVGSLNWTPTSTTENREVVVAVRDERVASYYRRVVDADWRGPDGRSVPPTMAVVGVGVAALTALIVARRLSFADVGA